jgi:hypothetical protein
MASEAFAANPIGIEYKPDELLARFKSGVDPKTLLQMPAGSPSGIPQAHGMT